LASLKLPDTTITLTQSVPGGAVTPPSGEPIQSVPPFCRVQGEIKPTSDSDIQFEVWMPTLGWNGKFRGVGNGGFAGVVNFSDMAPAVRNGYATVSTNTGHVGGQTDSNWALGHPEKLVDLGFRGVHEMTEKGKAIIRAYYGRDPQWSFFEGCSNGGREALMEAQRFPGDYQGILAGAPALFATRLLAMALYNTGASPPSYIPASKIPAISAAVLAACDAEDGVSDGILNDPRRCHFDPSVLRCRGAEGDNCLNQAQVAQLKKIYAGLQNSRGEQLFPGFMPGGEEGEDGWAGGITGPAPGQGGMFTFGLNYFRGMVFGDTAWDYRKISAERAVRIADEKTARTMNATDPDLRPFKARGGKLILYHGWSDSGIPAMSTINYYDSVAARMGSHETDDFVRLYMAPGMQHCFEGPGPNSFGQFDFSSFGAGAQQVARGTDPQHSVSSALEQWVENGVAPGPIIATKYVNDLDPSQGVKMTRPLCPYPLIAKYKGSGNTNDAANFVCSPTNNE
jgi:feruloyl esterase